MHHIMNLSGMVVYYTNAKCHLTIMIKDEHILAG